MNNRLTSQDFARITDVSRETLQKLELYAQLVTKWQSSIGLVGKSTIPDLWRRHMLDSAQLIRHASKKSDAWLDLGSGAGFPGMVVSLLGATEVHLVESNQRKCEFLQEVKRQTDAPVAIHNVRVEALELSPVDVVTARALAPLTELLTLAHPFMSSDTQCLFLKGQHVADELTDVAKHWNMSAERITSMSDHRGTIVRLTEVSHV